MSENAGNAGASFGTGYFFLGLMGVYLLLMGCKQDSILRIAVFGPLLPCLGRLRDHVIGGLATRPFIIPSICSIFRFPSFIAQRVRAFSAFSSSSYAEFGLVERLLFATKCPFDVWHYPNVCRWTFPTARRQSSLIIIQHPSSKFRDAEQQRV